MYWNPNGQFHRISPPEISLKEYKYYEILQKTSAKGVDNAYASVVASVHRLRP